MNVVGTILLVSVLLLPAVAVVALGWARNHGQLADADRSALLPFDETEPVGQVTDRLFERSGACTSAAVGPNAGSISPSQA